MPVGRIVSTGQPLLKGIPTALYTKRSGGFTDAEFESPAFHVVYGSGVRSETHREPFRAQAIMPQRPHLLIQRVQWLFITIYCRICRSVNS